MIQQLNLTIDLPLIRKRINTAHEKRLQELLERQPKKERKKWIPKEERIKQEEIEKRSIYSGSPQTAATLQADLISGKGRWRALGVLEWEQAEAERKRIAEGEELVIIEEPEF